MLVALRMPGSSTMVDDEAVGNLFNDQSTSGRQIKIIDFARDEEGLALYPSNGNSDEPQYEAEVTKHNNSNLIGRHSTVKASTLEKSYLPNE